MPGLFSPLKLKGVTLRNRIVVSPMCQYSSVDGFATDWHLVHLGSRAVGGAGLIFSEATAISPEGRISPDDLGIWKDEHIEKLKQITSFLKAQGAVSGIQLAHAGRKASAYAPWKGSGQVTEGSWQTVAPSAVGFSAKDHPPVALDRAGINKVIDDFGNASVRALQSGFEVLEIHAAHGYLVHQFLSPLSNLRDDEYGGSFENRIRLLLQIIERVKEEWPEELPLFVRISATDWADGGWNEEDSVRLAGILKERGVDAIDVSTGGLVPGVKIPIGPAYQLPFAARIKAETGMLTGTVGLITEAEQSNAIVEREEADLVFIARESLRNPYFPINAASVLGENYAWPEQYERAKPV
jgi:2,4-dienoyl-CoA reductase-like NADH-dependent reductase (Old Yellow Enzyme family)